MENNPTLFTIQAKKIELEDKVSTLIRDFEKETTVPVRGILVKKNYTSGETYVTIGVEL